MTGRMCFVFASSSTSSFFYGVRWMDKRMGMIYGMESNCFSLYVNGDISERKCAWRGLDFDWSVSDILKYPKAGTTKLRIDPPAFSRFC